ncbi:isonitrile hydratase [Geobacter sp. OR-1]|uniref:DJ-1/PfpI family protein n=1 Tax=Geobacter sp. OR-1 TaxID=1266765 RepID=UPI00054208AF|nr:DJ-1/PfpI family protein [Geobacter sp. OR-1]GAM10893.1 isonitrile hydratase [Geobacter sp. OR-1]
MNEKLQRIIAAVLLVLACIVGRGEAKGPEVQTAPPTVQKKVLGVFIFPGFEMLDAYGPMELWGNLRHAPAPLWGGEEKRVAVEVVTIAARQGEVASAQGPKTVADYGFDNAPALDYLLVPGGMAVFPLLKDRATLDWLKAQAMQTPLVMSVCNGASFLAAAGILDNRPATTNKMFWKMSTDPGPKAKWVKKARWVDDGTVVTASGVSAGMDMSLAVIGRLYGQGIADWLAQVTEYDAHRDPTWDPFAKKAGLVE